MLFFSEILTWGLTNNFYDYPQLNYFNIVYTFYLSTF